MQLKTTKHKTTTHKAMKFSVKFLLGAALLLVSAPVQGETESCIECHLHRPIVEDFTAGADEADTLAGFHGREFARDDKGRGCGECHGELRRSDKPPGARVCISCHTIGKAGQGDRSKVFHAQKEHWIVETVRAPGGDEVDKAVQKISCVDCHKAHARGNREIKFLTSEVARVCAVCHQKTFRGE